MTRAEASNFLGIKGLGFRASFSEAQDLGGPRLYYIINVEAQIVAHMIF